MFRTLSTVLLLSALALGQATTSAQYPQYPGAYPQTPTSDEQDLAGQQQHGVARLSIVQGDVNVKRGDTGDLSAAVMNAPLMTHDHLQTSTGSRAEVEFDSANLLRIAPNSDVGFADLQYRRLNAQLGTGTVIYRVLRPSSAQAEIDTPSIAFRPATQGEYRISVLDDGTTQITIRSGEAEIDSPRGSERLSAGHTTLVRGTLSDPEFQSGCEIARDQFDDWSETRDGELMASRSYQYVSPDVNGADDLDRYGNWVPSQYGQVWAPQAPVPNWAPYSYGQWNWEDYYGWTWVDYAPWGWAPYHYGRWFWNGGYGWCWWPGARTGSYFWNPALVGFFGWGGGLGWVALAPFEVFHPWWGRGYWHDSFGWHGGLGFGRFDGFGYMRNERIEGMYRNAGIRGGAMTAGYEHFGGPNQRFSPATRGQLSNASMFRGQMPVSPTRSSFLYSGRQAVVNSRLNSAANRSFFQRQQFPTPQGNFSGGQHGVAPNMGGRSPAPSYSPPSATASGGWQRFGDPGHSSGARQGFAPNAGESGWHRFGQPQVNAVRPSITGPAPQRQGFSGFGGNGASPRYSAPPSPRYSAPAMPRYSAPSTPHYSAPSAPHYESRGDSRGSGSSFHSGGGGGNRGGGGRSSSSGGHRGR